MEDIVLIILLFVVILFVITAIGTKPASDIEAFRQRSVRNWLQRYLNKRYRRPRWRWSGRRKPVVRRRPYVHPKAAAVAAVNNNNNNTCGNIYSCADYKASGAHSRNITPLWAGEGIDDLCHSELSCERVKECCENECGNDTWCKQNCNTKKERALQFVPYKMNGGYQSHTTSNASTQEKLNELRETYEVLINYQFRKMHDDMNIKPDAMVPYTLNKSLLQAVRDVPANKPFIQWMNTSQTAGPLDLDLRGAVAYHTNPIMPGYRKTYTENRYKQYYKIVKGATDECIDDMYVASVILLPKSQSAGWTKDNFEYIKHPSVYDNDNTKFRERMNAANYLVSATNREARWGDGRISPYYKLVVDDRKDGNHIYYSWNRKAQNCPQVKYPKQWNYHNRTRSWDPPEGEVPGLQKTDFVHDRNCS